MNGRTIAQQSTDEYIDNGEMHIRVAKRRLELAIIYERNPNKTYQKIADETGYSVHTVRKDIGQYKKNRYLRLPSKVNYLNPDHYREPPDPVIHNYPGFTAAHLENLREKERQAWEGREAIRIAEALGAKDNKRFW